MSQDDTKSIASYLFGGVFGFSELILEFVKSPTSFYEISILDDSLKKAAALYLISGVIIFFTLSKLNDQFETIFGEKAPGSALYGAASSPVVGELIQAVYGLLFLVVMIPASLILKSSPPGKSFNQLMLFFFSIGSIGAFLYASAMVISALPSFSAETADQLLNGYSAAVLIPSVITLFFIPFYIINLKRFSVGRSWGRVVIALVVSALAAIPFQLMLGLVISAT
ncbi:MAG: hypothetical protein AB2551_00270 [Candidatus Thiodiazotropha sp.]